MWLQVMEMLSQMVFLVLSVVNSGSFPKPLGAKQEREALEAMAKGDAAARQRLIEHNLRLVAHIIKKHYAHARDQEDLISIGTVGLIKAVDTFDVSKGSRLATYASRCIENEIRMYFRSAKKTERDVSLSDPIDTDSEGGVTRAVPTPVNKGFLIAEYLLKCWKESYLRSIYPFAQSSSAVSIAPPAAPRTVLWLRHTKR